VDTERHVQRYLQRQRKYCRNCPAVDANAYEQGATVTVKASNGNLVRTGYTFAGWNANALYRFPCLFFLK
jgi:hypothetical protein